jgi:hypothetical protein
MADPTITADAAPMNESISPNPLDKQADAPKENEHSHPLDEFVMGYPRMAARMGLIPETAMFRRFGALNCRNILYLQNELCQLECDLQKLECDLQKLECDLQKLECDLQKLEWADNESTTGMKRDYACDAYWLKSASAARHGDAKQRDLVMRLRATLREYSSSFRLLAMCATLTDS